MFRGWAMFWAALWMALLAPPAGAEADPAAAEALFRDAKAALARGATDEACAKFRESNRLDPAVGTTFNLADCEERRGRIGTAWALFVEARNRLAPSDERKSQVDARIEALEPRLARLTIRLAGDPPAGTRVTRDGIDIGAASFGTPVVVDPGERVIVVEAPGHEARSFTIQVGEGERAEIEVAPGAEVPDAASGEEPSKTSLHPVGLTLVGVGLAAIGVGIGLGVAAKGDYDDAEARCPNNVCDQQGFDQRSEAITSSHVGTGLFFGGLALALAGGVVEIVELTGAEPAATGRITPWVVPEQGRPSAGLHARWPF